MNILLLGSGGREHAFARYISQSPDCTGLWIAPGNAGTANCGTNVPVSPLDFESVFQLCQEHEIDILIPASEDPLVAGIRDYMENKYKGLNRKIGVAGPDKWAAQLEGSKDFSKEFMLKNQIPTARSFTANASNIDAGYDFLELLKAPYVLKADGLAAGKGVIITEDIEEAKAVLHDMILNQRFGQASGKVVIEEYLHGIEISVFVVSDGNTWKLLGSAKDYKRIGEGDTGLNTGGMGAISPVPFAKREFMQKVEDRIIRPTFDGLKKEGHSFTGFLFIGLMNCQGDPYVIEYNVRMGDPETEALFPRLQSDLLHLMDAMVKGTLEEYELKMDNQTAACIFLVSGGYPGEFEKGKVMTIPQGNSLVFHAGTKAHGGEVLTNGGRVLAITSLGTDIASALAQSVAMAESVQYEGKYYRRDIGQDLIKLNTKTGA